ncbi:hypothetical protein B484DRAFT_449472 [Ochromonadaceae sp. CCMP2298]|nr:hypothetical protein B484DRAFT_449472 [Ochromonadaceae sp. CCMP2298]|mmetsp:Transcript_13168/g.28864  ORF Transcript_13168/g.28864 Transcript_13168/m.28864 type:complete len:367 (-) Transcript_13168:178-1278(-)
MSRPTLVIIRSPSEGGIRVFAKDARESIATPLKQHFFQWSPAKLEWADKSGQQDDTMTAEEMKSILLLSDDVSSVRIVYSPEADCVRKNGIYDYYQHVNECDYIVRGKTEYGPGVCFDYMERGKCSREGCTFYKPRLMLAWRDGHLQVHMAVRDVTCWGRVLESYMETKEYANDFQRLYIHPTKTPLEAVLQFMDCGQALPQHFAIDELTDDEQGQKLVAEVSHYLNKQKSLCSDRGVHVWRTGRTMHHTPQVPSTPQQPSLTVKQQGVLAQRHRQAGHVGQGSSGDDGDSGGDGDSVGSGDGTLDLQAIFDGAAGTPKRACKRDRQDAGAEAKSQSDEQAVGIQAAVRKVEVKAERKQKMRRTAE